MRRYFILLLALMFPFVNHLFAQVAIYPPAVFIDAQSRSGSMTVLNQGEEPKEIQVSPKFGYMGYDSLGNIKTCYDDSVAEKNYSIVPYLTVFPKKFVLQPKKDQVVRFLIKNTGKMPDGMYYTRIVTESKDIKKQIDTTNLGDKVKIGLSFKFNFITVLIFEKGTLNTKVEILSLTTRTDSADRKVVISFKRDGNAPFLGTAKLKISKSNGDELETKEEKIPIYFSSSRAFSFKKDKLVPGKYKAEITLTGDQPDIPDDMKVPFEPVTKTFEFTVE